MDDDARYEAAQTAGGVIGGIGGAIALVITGVLTVRAFVSDGLGAGLLWLFVLSPLVTLIVYWLTLALAGSVALVLRGRRR